MDQATHNKIVSFLWGIANEGRDLFKRGNPDVIVPMCVLRRLDAVLEPTQKSVVEARKLLDQAGITEQRAALCQASGQAFYNTSKFTLRDLKSRGSQHQLRISRPTWMVSRPMFRTFWTTSNFGTRSRSPRLTPSAP